MLGGMGGSRGCCVLEHAVSDDVVVVVGETVCMWGWGFWRCVGGLGTETNKRQTDFVTSLSSFCLVGQERGVTFFPPGWVYWRSFRNSLALLRSLKKSEASAVVSPVVAWSFLSGWYLRASCQ